MLIFININLHNCSIEIYIIVVAIFILCSVSFIVCVVLCAVFHLIVVLFCVMCVICLLCLIVNHCHRVKTHLQLINITLHYITFRKADESLLSAR
jgi:hypothetical protein